MYCGVNIERKCEFVANSALRIHNVIGNRPIGQYQASSTFAQDPGSFFTTKRSAPVTFKESKLPRDSKDLAIDNLHEKNSRSSENDSEDIEKIESPPNPPIKSPQPPPPESS